MSGSKFIEFEKELEPYKKVMAVASDAIRDQDISKYPIFVVHQHSLEIGISILSEDEPHPWSIQASSLEEFVSKQIVEKDKVDSFREVYKSPDEYFCVFIVSELGAKFIFMNR